MQKVSKTNTKQEIWDAYQGLIRNMQEQMHAERQARKADVAQAATDETPQEPQKEEELTFDKVMNSVSTLKTNINETLNQLSDRLAEEMEKLNEVRKKIADENEELETTYKIKAEAESLLKLIELQQTRRLDFEKRMAEAEERLQNEMETRRRKWTQEEEEYSYNLKLKRRREEAEYVFAKEERERELNERENALVEREKYIADLEAKAAVFPQQLEKEILDAKGKLKARLEQEFSIAKQLREKEVEKEQAIFELKVAGLEETVKGERLQIANLARQLELATQKAQDLAVKIVETRKENERAERAERSEKSDDSRKQEYTGAR